MNKLKELLFSPLGWLLIPIVIILAILLSNMGTILERVGFETRTHLKAELVRSQYTVQLLSKEIIELRNKVDNVNLQCKIREEVINEVIQGNNDVDDFINNLNKGNITPSEDTIKTEPIKEANEVIEPMEVNNNIVSLHKAYNEFFGG